MYTAAAFRGHESQIFPSKDQEAELIRLAQAGDQRAGDELLARLRPLVVRLVRERNLSGVREPDDLRADLEAAGMAALWVAILRFDPGKNCRLSTYATPWIEGEIGAAIKAYRRRGGCGESRLERYSYYHRGDPEAVAKHSDCSLREAESAIAKVRAREQYLVYDEHEYDEEKVPRPAWLVPPRDDSSLTRLRHLGRLADGIVGDTDRVEHETNRRALRRLKEIGRRAYALELVEQDHARIAARSEPTQYLRPEARIAPPRRKPTTRRRSTKHTEYAFAA